MSFIKKLLTIFFLLFLISNSVVSANVFLSNGDTLSLDNYEVNQLDISSEEKKAFGVTFNNDGTKMFMVGETSGNDGVADDVHEYVLSTPYDISTATFRVGFSTLSENKTLRDLLAFFKS